MNQKVSPYLYRLGYHFSWKNIWPLGYNESKYIIISYQIRIFLNELLKKFEISSLNIFFYSLIKMNITIITSYPNIFLQNKQKELNLIKSKLKKFLLSKKIKLDFSLSILRENFHSISAQQIALHISNNLSQFKSLNFIAKEIIRKYKYQLEGLRIEVKGRIRGKTMCSKKIFVLGVLPLSTISKRIEYSFQKCYSKTSGILGIKVYLINKFKKIYNTKKRKRTSNSNNANKPIFSSKKTKIYKNLEILTSKNDKIILD